MDDPLLGETIGNYRLVSLLGKGGMGRVYLGEHPEIGRQVAIKVIVQDETMPPGTTQRFVSEARAVARIPHPGIIDIYDFGRTSTGQLYYTMELLPGCDLEEILKERGQMHPEVVVAYALQICDALAAAHATGVVHRDLKPANIFVVNQNPLTIKILDFGIAKMLGGDASQSGLTQTGAVMGTPLYMAPEQAAGRTNLIDHRTDIYALGATLYHMLAGRPPFMDRAPAVVLAMHIKEPATPLCQLVPHVPPALAAVVERCLAKDPEERFPSASELAEALQAAMGGAKLGTMPTLADPSGAMKGLDVGTQPTVASVGAYTGPSPMGTRGLAAPAPGVAPSLVDKPLADTTLGGSVGEVTRKRQGDRKHSVQLMAAALTLLIAAGAVWFALSRASNGEHEASPMVAAKRAVSTDTEAPPQYLVTIATNVANARCRLTVGTRQLDQRAPCRYEVAADSKVELTVHADGYAPFRKEWQIRHDHRLRLEAGKNTQGNEALLLVVAAAPKHAGAGEGASTHAAAKARRRVTKGSSRRRGGVDSERSRKVRRKRGSALPTDNIDPWDE